MINLVHILNLGHLSPQQFLKLYWQKKPLFLKSAFTDHLPQLSAEELLGLCLEEDIESRLIMHDGQMQDWQVEHGPFAESLFANELPHENWTVLIQKLNFYFAEVQALQQPFRFIPDWRFDDVMLSVAVPGGTVGAHIDNYDVFIIQGEGKRHWKVGLPNPNLAELIPHPSLKLTEHNFPAEINVELQQGDLLYIPAHHPHHCVASTDSVSYSVGFRAPSQRELLPEVMVKWLRESDEPGPRYSDADLLATEKPGEITEAQLDKLHTILMSAFQDKQHFKNLIAESLSSLGDDVMFAETEPDEVQTWLSQQNHLTMVPGARLFYQIQDQQLVIYANGNSHVSSLEHLSFIENLIKHREITDNNFANYLNTLDFSVLISMLINRGVIESELDANRCSESD